MDEEQLLKQYAVLPFIVGAIILAVLWFIAALLGAFNVQVIRLQFAATPENAVGLLVLVWLIGLVMPPLTRLLTREAE